MQTSDAQNQTINGLGDYFYTTATMLFFGQGLVSYVDK